MAKNDVVLLDGIIDDRLAENLPSNQRDEVFEYFVLEELLKDYDLSKDDIESGWIDGRDDGGIDGFYILVNGHLLDDPEAFVWPRTHAAVDVWIVTCKHHSTFQQAPLDSLLATIGEIFDLSRKPENLKGSYSEDLLAFRELFHTAYRKLSIGRPVIRFIFVYGSRGDINDLGGSVVARARQIEGVMSHLFSASSVEFRFVGASELVEQHRKSKTFAIDLPFLEHLATGKDSYVLLVRLEDYWNFVSDERGNLRRYLFDSNVRDYVGSSGVNEDIAYSLADASAPDFWWLNNGVTILATNATIPGKTIQLQDIQIVNGLQTTETIFRHFTEGSRESANRALLVKIIVSSDEQARDRIIRATNNQNPVEIAALHATDRIQRDIEQILERHSWYYERRRNYYRNIGKPQARFVTPIYVASAVVALILKNPSLATRIRTKFMRTREGYESVFSTKLPIEVWPILVEVFKGVDAGFLSILSSSKRGERFASNWRSVVAIIVVARRFGTFAYHVQDFISIMNEKPVTVTDVADVWDMLMAVGGQEFVGKKLKTPFIEKCCDAAGERFHLSGLEEIGKRYIVTPAQKLFDSEILSDAFLEEVNRHLPKQPWKSGMHLQVAKEMGIRIPYLSAGIQRLIELGKRYTQRNGILYDSKGDVIAADAECTDQRSESDSSFGIGKV